MRLTGRSSRTKFIAKLMTFVWLFSLAVSVANACVLQAGRAGPPTAHQSGLADAHVAGPPSAVDDQHQATPAQQTCKHFCDIEQSTVAKAAALDLSHAAPPPAATGVWPMRAAPRADAAWRSTGAAPPPHLALAILFLRLTL